MMDNNPVSPIAVIGATGYVGGRLVPLLLDRGRRVRAVGRSTDKLRCRPWAGHPDLEIASANVFDSESLNLALKGCGTAYYLVHSMSPGKEDFSERDRRAAENMAAAAADQGVGRIIYLSGLGEERPDASKHLKSRAEVASILHSGSTPVTVLRAAQILGAGSASFELIRYLAERLPVMVTPRWVHTEAQPIAIRDVLHYLAGVLELSETAGQTYDIGGPEALTYRRLFGIYCEEAGLRRRLIIPVPFLTPKLSSLWVGLVTPLPPSVARPLIGGLKTRVVCEDFRIRSLLPRELTSCRQAIRLALDKVKQETVETCWSDAGPLVAPEWTVCGDADYAGGTVYSLSYGIRLETSAKDLFSRIKNLGGGEGYFFATPLWKIRGWLDVLAGGPGLKRGRREDSNLQVGDALDFWRVLDIQESRRLLLLAEMRTPGEALLEFQLKENMPGETELVMRSRFLPRGLLGIAYWWLLYPAHVFVFRGLLKSLAKSVKASLLRGPYRLSSKEAERACRL